MLEKIQILRRLFNKSTNKYSKRSKNDIFYFIQNVRMKTQPY